jgi:nitrogen PTS system EIIA component
MRILDFLREDGVINPLQANSKEAVLAELVEPITRTHPHVNRDKLLRTLMEREGLGSTGIGGGIAIPLAKFDGLDQVTATFGRSPRGVDFNSLDHKPAHLFFLLVAPRDSAGDHLKALARISRLLSDPLLLSSLQKSDSSSEVFHLIENYDLMLPEK